MFSEHRAPKVPGHPAVLLDGDTGSFALFPDSNVQQASDNPLSWAWSANLTHSLFVNGSVVQVRRWDDLQSSEDFPVSDENAAIDLFERLSSAQSPAKHTVIEKMISVFRVLRSNVEELGGNEVDLIRVFNSLLSGLDWIRQGLIGYDLWASANTVGGFLTQLHPNERPVDFISTERVLDLSLRDLMEALVARDPETQHILDPDLLVRHAAGILYQEAHGELTKLPFQPRLFDDVTIKPSKPSAPRKRDVHFTPPSLARVLVQLAIAELKKADDLPSRLRIADPAAGSGVFLIEAMREIANTTNCDLTLIGMDESDVSCDMMEYCLQRIATDWPSERSLAIEVSRADSLLLPTWQSPDIILMNPPFISWNSMTATQRTSVRNVLGQRYIGHSDTSIAFVAKAIDNLRPGGVLASVVPAPFLESHAASKLRESIDGISFIGRFRGYEYFKDATVEPGFIVVVKSPSRPKAVSVALAESGFEDFAIRTIRRYLETGTTAQHSDYEVSRIDRSQLPHSSWMPRRRQSRLVMRFLAEANLPLVDDLFHVRLGIRTGFNEALLLSDHDFAKLGDEQKFFRPAADNDTIGDCWIEVSQHVFYPYDVNRKPLFKDEDDLRKRCPRFYQSHLWPHTNQLQQRRSLRGRPWLSLVEPRLTWQCKLSPKIISTAFGDRGSFAYDESGRFAVLQGFGWLWKTADDFHNTPLPWAYLALLNSRVFESLLSHFCPTVRGGQFDLYPKYVKQIAIPDLRQVAQEIMKPLAAIGQKMATGETAEPRAADELVSAAYGIPLDDLYGMELSRREEIAKRIPSESDLELIAVNPPAEWLSEKSWAQH
ncbi:MAG: N-6 DNA methylase [Planctomycetes bacterium]|nr:N-6 DNA methylase [Planctomycetota bacterium]